MNRLKDDDNDDDLLPRQDRELTLSTGAIIGLFFGLVLLCGLFFALGYNMGHKANQVTPSADEPDSSSAATPSSPTNFNAFKPSAGSPANSASPSSNTVSVPTPSTSATTPPAATRNRSDEDTPTPRATPPPAPIVRTPPTMTTPVAPVVAPSSYMVQVAAVSHQEDADLLVAALKAKGYTVTAHQDPQDRLLHIQVGPFTTRKDADAMRARLLNDGYNAILK